MKKIFLFAGIVFSFTAFGQIDSNSLRTRAKTYMQTGDYANATLVLNKAIQQAPNDVDLQNDLIFNYYLAGNYAKAIEMGKRLTTVSMADVRSYQLLGMSYRAIEELKDAEKLYKTGIEKFPTSGVLYNEYGEFLWQKKKLEDAIAQWQKGIAADPNYSGNYYNAAKYYYVSTDKIWALIYGELFLNLESYSRRTPEMKELLLDAYKKYYTNMQALKTPDSNNGFEKSFAALLNKHAATVSDGVTAASLTKLRTKIILDWFEKEPVKYPFRLFDYQRQLLKAGYFDAYNQWIFGAAQNLTDFQKWTQENQKVYDDFIAFQRGRVFKVPSGQLYK